jgi:hypothetical protein
MPPPADPSQRTQPSTDGERDPYEADESELGDVAGPDAFDLDALVKQANVPGLLALAKAYRAGTAPGGRDMGKCLDAYRAAAALGSAEAEYGVALFSMNGGTTVPQDLRQGTLHLRAAAEKGSVPAKVYLGNLYELGIHYKADAEKADVWYRNAARGAHVEAEQGTAEWILALAELGCARFALLLSRDPTVPEDEKRRLLARAKAHGYALRMREDLAEGDRVTFVDALTSAESATATAAHTTSATGTPPPVAVNVGARGATAGALPLEPRQRKDTSPETAQAKRRAEESRAKTDPPKAPLDPAAALAAEKAERLAKKKSAERSARVGGALAAFGYAMLFALAGAGAGYAATLGAQELVAHGHVLPLVGTRARLVFPIVLGVVGILPAWLVYKLGAMVKALALGATLGAVGWVAWGTGQYAFHGDRPLQAIAFGLAGFLAALLVLGLVGGAKLPRATQRPRGAR